MNYVLPITHSKPAFFWKNISNGVTTRMHNIIIFATFNIRRKRMASQRTLSLRFIRENIKYDCEWSRRVYRAIMNMLIILNTVVREPVYSLTFFIFRSKAFPLYVRIKNI